MPKKNGVNSKLDVAGREWKKAKRHVSQAVSTTLEGVQQEAGVFRDWVKSGEGAQALKTAGQGILDSFRSRRKKEFSSGK